MNYLGGGKYQVFLTTGESILDEEDILTIISEYKTLESTSQDITDHKRPYNTNKKIFKLFRKYYSNNKTKIETFKLISNELNISVKAVEKAYYKK